MIFKTLITGNKSVMTEETQNGWITKSTTKTYKNDHTNMIKFLDSNICNHNRKLKLPASSFPSCCVCGHLQEFRPIIFCPDNLPGTDVAKIAPVNVKLRSL